VSDQFYIGEFFMTIKIRQAVPAPPIVNPVSTFTDAAVSAVLAHTVIRNEPIVAGTHTKITYDEKGLVTSGTELVASDIPDISATYATHAQGLLADSALQDASLFATAAQGLKADSALQNAGAFATAAQGLKADSALQPSALNGYATQNYVTNAISNIPTSTVTLNDVVRLTIVDEEFVDSNFSTSVQSTADGYTHYWTYWFASWNGYAYAPYYFKMVTHGTNWRDDGTIGQRNAAILKMTYNTSSYTDNVYRAYISSDFIQYGWNVGGASSPLVHTSSGITTGTVGGASNGAQQGGTISYTVNGSLACDLCVVSDGTRSGIKIGFRCTASVEPSTSQFQMYDQYGTQVAIGAYSATF
jgi:hypothetical protein